MTEDLFVTQQKLAQAKDIITNLEKAAHQNTYDEKKHEELERLNGQLTKDIDYLRGVSYFFVRAGSWSNVKSG